MTVKLARLLLVVGWLGVLGTATASADPSAIDPRSAQGTPIVEAAVDAAGAALTKPVRLEVRRLNVSGDWAFVFASMRGIDGEPIDYTGTPFAEAAANHARSRTYAGLSRYDGNRWAIVDQAIGPTDVAWQAWPQRYGIPQALVEVPES